MRGATIVRSQLSAIATAPRIIISLYLVGIYDDPNLYIGHHSVHLPLLPDRTKSYEPPSKTAGFGADDAGGHPRGALQTPSA